MRAPPSKRSKRKMQTIMRKGSSLAGLTIQMSPKSLQHATFKMMDVSATCKREFHGQPFSPLFANGERCKKQHHYLLPTTKWMETKRMATLPKKDGPSEKKNKVNTVKGTLKTYGTMAVVVHSSVYILTLGSIYGALSMGWDIMPYFDWITGPLEWDTKTSSSTIPLAMVVTAATGR